ncbi:MAG: hypothetical protein GF347_04330 [Candidatus Moranbacteria bacterium]|nr:hypothetical protein [Candidatus Moranbacteria bacterium]
MENLNSDKDVNKYLINQAVRREKRKRRLDRYDKLMFFFFLLALVFTVSVYLYYYKGIGRGFVKRDWPQIEKILKRGGDKVKSFFSGMGLKDSETSKPISGEDSERDEVQTRNILHLPKGMSLTYAEDWKAREDKVRVDYLRQYTLFQEGDPRNEIVIGVEDSLTEKPEESVQKLINEFKNYFGRGNYTDKTLILESSQIKLTGIKVDSFVNKEGEEIFFEVLAGVLEDERIFEISQICYGPEFDKCQAEFKAVLESLEF